MSEYISREAVKELFDGIYDCADLVFEPDDQICAKQHSSCGSCRWVETKRAIQKRVMSIPAADVRPVVLGRWVLDSDPGEPWRYVCNICGEKTRDTVMGNPRARFCPNCGADMREKS